MVNTKLINTFVINLHAPTEVSDHITIYDFYDELIRVYEGIQKYAIKIVMGNMNSKYGR